MTESRICSKCKKLMPISSALTPISEGLFSKEDKWKLLFCASCTEELKKQLGV